MNWPINYIKNKSKRLLKKLKKLTLEIKVGNSYCQLVRLTIVGPSQYLQRATATDQFRSYLTTPPPQDLEIHSS